MQRFTVMIAVYGILVGSFQTSLADTWSYWRQVPEYSSRRFAAPQVQEQPPADEEENAVVPLPQWPVPSRGRPRVVFPEHARTAQFAKPIVMEGTPPRHVVRVAKVPMKGSETKEAAKVLQRR